jgi:phage terminase small subunit
MVQTSREQFRVFIIVGHRFIATKPLTEKGWSVICTYSVNYSMYLPWYGEGRRQGAFVVTS